MSRFVTLCLLLLLVLLAPRTGVLRLFVPDDPTPDPRPLPLTNPVSGESSLNGTFTVLAVVRLFEILISSDSASTVTLIFHGLKFW